MAEEIIYVSTLAAAVGCGLIAGVFFAFSVFVMRALARLPPEQGIAAMQSINVVVLNTVFLGVFMGTAALCAVLFAFALTVIPAGPALFIAAGALTYVVGTFVVTIAFNVPLNNELAGADPRAPASVSIWKRYLDKWMLWNHVRAAAAGAAMVMLIVGLTRLS